MLRVIALTLLVICSPIVPSAIGGESRVALVIGISEYWHWNKLPNAVNDAETMEQVLKDVHFDVSKLTNVTQKQLNWELDKFAKNIQKNNTVGLLYFSGHALQVNGVNYLIPIDSNINTSADLSSQAVNLKDFLKKLEPEGQNEPEGRVNLILLDACRDDPFVARALNTDQTGLAPTDAPTGTLISFATSPGERASDGQQNSNSPYVEALKSVIRMPGWPVEETFKETRKRVIQSTKKSGKPQRPWESTSLTGKFYFVPPNWQSATDQIESSRHVASTDDRNVPLLRDKAQIQFQFYGMPRDIAEKIGEKLSVYGWDIPEREETKNARNYNEIRYNPNDSETARLLAKNFDRSMQELDMSIKLKLVEVKEIPFGLPEIWISIR